MFNRLVVFVVTALSFSVSRASVQYDHLAVTGRIVSVGTGEVAADDMRFEGPIVADSMVVEIAGNGVDFRGRLLIKIYKWDSFGKPDTASGPLFDGEIPLPAGLLYTANLGGVQLPRRVFVVLQTLDNDSVVNQWFLTHTWEQGPAVGYTELGGWQLVSGVWQRAFITPSGGGLELSLSIDGTLSYVQGPCPGDANEDRAVNGADLSVFMAQSGTTIFPTAGADFNGDGLVNGADLTVLLNNWQHTCSP